MPPIHGEYRLEPVHSLHAILLGFPFPLFLGALLADVAYWGTFQVQWSHFSSWLISGAVLAGTFLLIWSVVDLVRSTARRKGRSVLYFLALLVMWVLGFVNALVHAKDAWGVMPAGLYLSIALTLVAFFAAWVGYSGVVAREVH